MEWCPLPRPPIAMQPVQWVGYEDGQEIAWITQGRLWGEPGHSWLVATPHGTAAGCRSTLEAAQRSVEAVLREHKTKRRQPASSAA
ncbi:MAG: hypothetical protein U1E17_14690 [Geminicoccaceae bacterium]